MAGTIGLSLSQRLDKLGKPLAGGQLFFFAAGTSTPQNAFIDSGLTLPHPNPITLDAAGNIPQFFLADGQIKVVLTDKFGITQLAADNVLVIGPSSGGGGGGGSVDPTTVFQTGMIYPAYGIGPRSGSVRMNGRTIGNAVSGATERPNADTAALFAYLYSADSNLVVSGGRGASAGADYAAGKTIALPDLRGRVLAGLDDMGNTAAGRLTLTYYGVDATVLGAASGLESQTLTAPQLPNQSYLLAGQSTNLVLNSVATDLIGGVPQVVGLQGGGSNYAIINQATPSSAQRAVQGMYQPAGTIGPLGSSTPHPIVQPTTLTTYYIKL